MWAKYRQNEGLKSRKMIELFHGKAIQLRLIAPEFNRSRIRYPAIISSRHFGEDFGFGSFIRDRFKLY